MNVESARSNKKKLKRGNDGLCILTGKPKDPEGRRQSCHMFKQIWNNYDLNKPRAP